MGSPIVAGEDDLEPGALGGNQKETDLQHGLRQTLSAQIPIQREHIAFEDVGGLEEAPRLQHRLEEPGLGQPVAGLAAEELLRGNQKLMVEIRFIFGFTLAVYQAPGIVDRIGHETANRQHDIPALARGLGRSRGFEDELMLGVGRAAETSRTQEGQEQDRGHIHTTWGQDSGHFRSSEARGGELRNRSDGLRLRFALNSLRSLDIFRRFSKVLSRRGACVVISKLRRRTAYSAHRPSGRYWPVLVWSDGQQSEALGAERTPSWSPLQIVLGLQTIVSRQINLPEAPAVITIGAIDGGVRSNIIPDEVEMIGTIRTFEPAMRTDIHERIRKTAALIAQSGGAGADVTIDPGYPLTFNDPNLAARMVPTLQTTAGRGRAVPMPPSTGAEDFSYYQQKIPGLYFFLGVTPHGSDCQKAPMLHSPRFCADEGAMILGIRTLARLTISYMEK